jgi:hypothetical protein
MTIVPLPKFIDVLKLRTQLGVWRGPSHWYIDDSGAVCHLPIQRRPPSLLANGRVPLIVRVDDSILGGIQAHLLYVDGYIERSDPSFGQLLPENSIITLVKPGVHRLTVREADRRKASRLESDTLHVEFGTEVGAVFKLALGEGKLLLDRER